MTTTHRTFGTTIPAYFLGRHRKVYEARYAKKASVSHITEARAAAFDAAIAA